MTVSGLDDGVAPAPFVSVVLNTYNRSDLVGRAISSVKAQTFQDFELIVVDDGSTDDTLDVVRRFSNVAVLTHGNMGLTASRNAGARVSRAQWIAFLDDDDEVEPNWLEMLVGSAEAGTGIVFCGHQRVTPSGTHLESRAPRTLEASLGGVRGSYWPGTWIMRRDVFERAGGYLDGLPFIHQFELLIRTLRLCSELGYSVNAIDDPLLRYTVRDSNDRPMLWPQLAMDGGRWILSRHASLFDEDHSSKADLDGVVGVAAARMGRLDLTRRHLWRSWSANPTDPRRAARLVASLSPYVARRAWGRHEGPFPQLRPLPVVHRLPELHQRAEDHLFLPWGYQRNRQASADAAGSPYWEEPSLNNTLYQEPVYRFAARLMRRNHWRTAVDVGTGSGIKFERHVAPMAAVAVGFDQGSGIELARRRNRSIEWLDGDLMTQDSWGQFGDREPDLVICADVVEHVDDPVFLLQRLVDLIGARGFLLISTPDRMRFDQPNWKGPPGNTRHVREWTQDEFELLLESVGLEIVKRRRFLPRGYRPTVFEVKRSVWRLLHRMAVPDRRSNAAWLCRRSDDNAYTPPSVSTGDWRSWLHWKQSG